jgi:ABC-type multidrug transport system ATPase subunit
MHRPRLLILDEPTLGLDPLMQREFRHLVREAVDDGATVFLSSHVLSEVEAVCDRIGLIRDGRAASYRVADTLPHADRTTPAPQLSDTAGRHLDPRLTSKAH